MTNRMDQAMRDLSDSFASLEQAAKKLPFRLVGWDDENDKPEVEDEPLSEKEVDAIDEVQEIVDEMWSKVRELGIAYDLSKARAA